MLVALHGALLIQHLGKGADHRHRRTQVMRNRVREGLQFAVGDLQFLRAPGHPRLQFAVQAHHLPLPVRQLGAVRLHGFQHVVERFLHRGQIVLDAQRHAPVVLAPRHPSSHIDQAAQPPQHQRPRDQRRDGDDGEHHDQHQSKFPRAGLPRQRLQALDVDAGGNPEHRLAPVDDGARNVLALHPIDAGDAGRDRDPGGGVAKQCTVRVPATGNHRRVLRPAADQDAAAVEDRDGRTGVLRREHPACEAGPVQCLGGDAADLPVRPDDRDGQQHHLLHQHLAHGQVAEGRLPRLDRGTKVRTVRDAGGASQRRCAAPQASVRAAQGVVQCQRPRRGPGPGERDGAGRAFQAAAQRECADGVAHALGIAQHHPEVGLQALGQHARLVGRMVLYLLVVAVQLQAGQHEDRRRAQQRERDQSRSDRQQAVRTSCEFHRQTSG
jgi:hypothetical protein